MKQRNTAKNRMIVALLTTAIFAPIAAAEILYVDSITGHDDNLGTKEEPLCTLGKAATLVNKNSDSGPTIIKIFPGIYNLTQNVVFDNSRPYTENDRLTIEASVLPDDSWWKPQFMPVIFSTEDIRDPEKPDSITGTYGIRIKISHVTIRGLKFLGSPVPNNMYAPIERIDRGLEDLLVTQCMFVGDRDSFDIYCPAIATGHKFVVDHCIFYNCHASAVFWDGPEGISGKNNAMRYCIVEGGYISGVWTCQTSDDFEFHHNIVTDTEYFWMRKKIEHPIRYKCDDCIINVKNFSGYGVESGPLGETGAEVTYDRTNVVENARLTLVKDKNKRDYLHVVSGTLGSDLEAGLFKKEGKEKVKMQKSTHIEEGFISVNNVQLYYKVIGKGEPVVVLHGGPGLDHNHMLPLAELADNYKVVFYDQRTTGNSTGVPDADSITVDHFVQDLEEIRKQLKLDKIHLLGHSWGAGLAMFYSIKYPDNLKTLTLLGCGGASTEYFGEHFENIQKRTSQEDRLAMEKIEQSEAFKDRELEAFTKYFQIAVKPMFFDQSLAERVIFAYGDNTPKHQQAVGELLMKELVGFDIYDQLSSIHCPTLIIQGDSDPSPCEGTYKVHKHIKGSKVIFLQDTGHFILHESPEEFFVIMRKFLKDEKSVNTSIPEKIEKRLKSVPL